MNQPIMSDNYKWNSLRIGGGGYATGLIIHPKEEDLIYVRTDVGGLYRFHKDEERWIQLMDSFGLSQRNFYGIDSVAIDAQNADVIYVAAGKYCKEEVMQYFETDIDENPCDVLRSRDRGVTWERTNLNKDFRGNLAVRWNGECIAVDPSNSDYVVCGTRSDGLYIMEQATRNDNWRQLTGVPDGIKGYGIRSVMFDPNSVVNGRCQRFFVGICGEGVYETLDGGETFKVIPNTPLMPNRMSMNSEGTLFISAGYCDAKTTDVTRGVYRYDSGITKNITPDPVYKEYTGISVDPTNPERVVCSVRFNGFWNPIFISLNGGDNWELVTNQSIADADVPWFPSCYFSAATSSILINPHNPSQVYVTDWYAIWRTDDISKKPRHWKSYTQNYESMVSFTMICPPIGASIITGIADNDGMRHTNLKESPLKKHGGPEMQETTGIDFCENNPNFMARVGSWEWGATGGGGYSCDNGVNWEAFKNWPFGANGKLAMNPVNANNFVVLPIQDTPKVTFDAGVTWQESIGAPKGSVEKFWSNNHCLASDRVENNVYYIYHLGEVYRSSDGGVNWNKVSELPLETFSNIKAMPNQKGHVWVNLNHYGLYTSCDFGDTFTKLNNVDQAYLFAFGKGLSEDIPAVYVYGRVSGVEGIFRSDDKGTTWIRINDDANRIGNDPNCMEGDRQVYGRVYIGTNGRGYYYGEPYHGEPYHQ
jgi:xyloglucan-specific exo-beta-1,4-glucanase